MSCAIDLYSTLQAASAAASHSQALDGELATLRDQAEALSTALGAESAAKAAAEAEVRGSLRGERQGVQTTQALSPNRTRSSPHASQFVSPPQVASLKRHVAEVGERERETIKQMGGQRDAAKQAGGEAVAAVEAQLTELEETLAGQVTFRRYRFLPRPRLLDTGGSGARRVGKLVHCTSLPFLLLPLFSSTKVDRFHEIPNQVCLEL